MLKFNKSYLLIPILIFSFSGCVEKKVITINTARTPRTYHHQSIRPHIDISHRREEPIKEEILIKNNPVLFEEEIKRVVSVPTNRPTLDIKDSNKNIQNSTTTAEPTSSELNGEIIERMAFPEDEYSRLERDGNSTVMGNIYLESSITDSDIIGKNVRLYLNPVTSYSKQWYEQSYLGGYKMTPPDKRLYNYLKFTTSNSDGEFSFFGVPIGEYYLGAKLKCSEECGFNSPKIIRVVKKISVDEGTTNVDLSKTVP